ncbi:unnamed protein product [Didymodactylos carnosus]|uniref:PLAT domain-containing protein n=1 Tax=Didymodactylos carnosus TaxID=1234261 RepID=A0A8S2E1W0_9BILA|nr:unnamed protein product [Didymodactylos carnosus]CAF3878837.1 unnamed protein product [Didymodactylos carnosus]
MINPLTELKVLQLHYNGTFPWYCEKITVTDHLSGISYKFNVDRWFMDKTGDISVDVLGQREDDADWTYTVIVKTQAVLPAQTSLRGKIILSIRGKNSQLNDIVLGSGREMFQLFHAGNEDTIELKTAKRLVDISTIELQLDVAEYQSWLCDYIEIIDTAASWDTSSHTLIPKSYRFPINRWLGANAMDKKNTVICYVNKEPGYAHMPTYIVQVLTGNKNMTNETGIQVNVYLQMFGTLKVFGPILLDKSSNNTTPFRKGQTDEFHIFDLPYGGEIKKIRLFHDGGRTTSWNCEWFPVERLLDDDAEEGSSNLIIYSERKEDEGTAARILQQVL